jgi:hypothetical protein
MFIFIAIALVIVIVSLYAVAVIFVTAASMLRHCRLRASGATQHVV